MKIRLLITLLVAGCSTCAYSYNALAEHSAYVRDLERMTAKQRIENRKYLQSYKGGARYAGGHVSATSAQSPTSGDIYAKKGVKFKVDDAKQEQRLKEAQEKSAENVPKQDTASDKVTNYTQTTTQKDTKTSVEKSVETKIETQTKKQSPTQTKPAAQPLPAKPNHNADAE